MASGISLSSSLAKIKGEVFDSALSNVMQNVDGDAIWMRSSARRQM